MTKNANGMGSLYVEAGGYRAVATVGWTAKGQPIRIKAWAKTQAEARARLADRVRAHGRGAEAADARMTLGQYVARWRSSTLPLEGLSPATVAQYTYALDHHLLPELGRKPLAKLTPTDVERLLAKMESAGPTAKGEAHGPRKGDGYSKASIHIVKVVASKVLANAERDGIVGRNVARLAKSPKIDAAEGKRAMAPKQIATLLTALEGDRLYAPVYLLLSTGLRLGELLGLRWDAVDLKAKTLTVSGSLKRDGVISAPKTKTSRRDVASTTELVRVLKAHRKQQAAEQLYAGPAWSDEGLVFPSESGTPWNDSNFRHRFTKATTAAGLGSWSPHELRHTYATMGYGADVDLKTMSSVLGHSSVRVTADIYSHVWRPAHEAAAKIGALLPAPRVGLTRGAAARWSDTGGRGRG